jgi:hypothetical protein
VSDRLPSLGEMMTIGAAVGLVAAVAIGGPNASTFALPLAALGAGLGAWRSFRKVPDAPTCRIPRVLRGCGGSTTVRDRKGNSGPKRPCWGHPGGRPKRLVNIAVVAVEIAVAGVVVVVLAAYVKANP